MSFRILLDGLAKMLTTVLCPMGGLRRLFKRNTSKQSLSNHFTETSQIGLNSLLVPVPIRHLFTLSLSAPNHKNKNDPYRYVCGWYLYRCWIPSFSGTEGSIWKYSFKCQQTKSSSMEIKSKINDKFQCKYSKMNSSILHVTQIS